MRRILLGLAVIAGTGCDNLSFIVDGVTFNPQTVTLLLVNQTEFPVKPSVFVSDLNDIIFEGLTESFLTTSDNEQDFPNVDPGATVSYIYDCDDFKAVMAQEAELLVAPGISPENDTHIFIDDTDFDCGDTVTITFSGDAASFDARIRATAG